MNHAHADGLSGALTLHPGAALPTIRSTRREWAGQIARGRPAALLPGLLASVYSLCSGAHRVAAQHALQAAAGDAAPPTEARRAALQVDTLREHLRRWWLDAAALLPGIETGDPRELAGCPLMVAAEALPASRAWIEAHVLAMPAADWLQAWQADPPAFALAWSRAGASWPARWLAAAQPLLAGLHPRAPARPIALQAQGVPGELRRLAWRLRSDPDFALAPTWRGHTAETGCWTRLADRHGATAAILDGEPWLRLAARVADVAHLVAPGGERWLAQGALPLEPGEGLGWCEMARGLLIHWLRVDAQGRIEDCRLIAPTEWNFHPFGSAARALAALPPDASEIRVRLLAAAYDPCVAVRIERETEVQHA